MISPYLGTAVALGAHTSALRDIEPVGAVGPPGSGRPPVRWPVTLTLHAPAAALSLVACGARACASAGEDALTVVFSGTLATVTSMVSGEPHAADFAGGAATPAGGVTWTWSVKV